MMSFVILAVALFGLYAAISSSSTLWDRDEPRFARAAVEMWRSGDYLVPHFNEQLRPDKPVMIYWLMAAGLSTLGVTELAVRLPSCLGMVITAMATGWIGTMLRGRQVGLIAAGILGTSLLPLVMATLSTADAVLVAMTTLAIGCFVHRMIHGGVWPIILMALLMGGAQLVKGPLGLLVPMMTVVATWAIARRHDRRHRRLAQPPRHDAQDQASESQRDPSHHLRLIPSPDSHGTITQHLGRRFWIGLSLAALASVGIFAAWGIPANAATDGDLARIGLGRHVVERGIRPMEGHGGSNLLAYIALLPAYLPVIIAGLFPWTILLPAAVRTTWAGRLGQPRDRALLVGWVVPTFVVFTLYVTKLPHYMLPLFPALAIGCAMLLEAAARNDRTLTLRDHDWLKGGLWFYLPVAVGLIGALLGAAIWLSDGPMIRQSVLIALVVASASVVLIRWLVAENLGLLLKWTLTGSIGLWLLASLSILPRIEARLKISPQIASAVHRAVGPQDPVLMLGYNEPSLVFYLDRPLGNPVRKPRMGYLDLARWLAEPSPGALIITRERWTQLTLARFLSLRGMIDHAKAQAAGTALPTDGAIQPLPVTLVYESDTVNYAARARQKQVMVLIRSAGTDDAQASRADSRHDDPIPIHALR